MASDTDTRIVDDAEESRFALWGQDTCIGFIGYHVEDDVIVLVHTEVDPAFGGQGHGATLVRGALDAARERGLKVRPDCPFVASFIDEHEEYADLLATS